MKKYIGTKMIKAQPMTRGAYNEYRGWTIPENENPDDEGYLVVYTDSDNYESWSPKDVFDRAYRSCDGGMTFGGALELLKMGFKVARKGWNGKGMCIFKVCPTEIKTYANVGFYSVHQSIAMRTVDSSIVVGWLASQTDMLAEDWVVVE